MDNALLSTTGIYFLLGYLASMILVGVAGKFASREASMKDFYLGGAGFGVIVGQGVRYMKAYFAEEFGGDPDFLHDIGMEIKGMEISEYGTKESLAQQGGYGLATKGAQHDEA